MSGIMWNRNHRMFTVEFFFQRLMRFKSTDAVCSIQFSYRLHLPFFHFETYITKFTSCPSQTINLSEISFQIPRFPFSVYSEWNTIAAIDEGVTVVTALRMRSAWVTIVFSILICYVPFRSTETTKYSRFLARSWHNRVIVRRASDYPLIVTDLIKSWYIALVMHNWNWHWLMMVSLILFKFSSICIRGRI